MDESECFACVFRCVPICIGLPKNTVIALSVLSDWLCIDSPMINVECRLLFVGRTLPVYHETILYWCWPRYCSPEMDSLSQLFYSHRRVLPWPRDYRPSSDDNALISFYFYDFRLSKHWIQVVEEDTNNQCHIKYQESQSHQPKSPEQEKKLSASLVSAVDQSLSLNKSWDSKRLFYSNLDAFSPQNIHWTVQVLLSIRRRQPRSPIAQWHSRSSPF